MSRMLLKWPALTIYIVALVLSLKFAIFDYRLPGIATLVFENLSSSADSSIEYQLYLQIVNYGHILLQYRQEQILLVSSYAVTYLPALIQRLLQSDPYWTFRLYSAFIMPCLPVVIYYLARKWNSKVWSMICAALSFSWLIYLQGNYYERTNIALIFAMLMMLAIVTDKWNWKIRYPVIAISAAGMPMSHYSVTFGAIGILFASLVIGLIWRKDSYVKPIGYSILCLLGVVGVYYGLVYPGVLYKLSIVGNASVGLIPMPEQSAPVAIPTLIGSLSKGITMIGYFITILLIVGWLIVYKKEGMSRNVSTIGGMLAIGGAIAIPALQALYGFNRIQYQALLPAMVYFPMGVKALADKLSINSKLLAGIIVGGFLLISLVYIPIANRVGLL